MDHFEVTDALETFRILVDRREQRTPKASERYKSFGVPFEKVTLNYGDYCASVMIDGVPIYDQTKAIKPRCVIERKMSLDELASCFTRSRDRFRKEMERATASGCTVYLLVENGSYEAILGHRYRSRFSPNAFLASLLAWSVRYGLKVIFCKSDISGTLIREILFRDMKERLENGEYG